MTQTAPQQQQAEHWLDRYGKGYHAWRKDEDGKGWSRPCGLVEARFDTDGRYFGGRADISEILTVDLSTRLPPADLRQHVLLAFTLLRLQHSLIRGRAELRTHGVVPWFRVDIPETAEHAVRDAAKALQFVTSDDGQLDPRDLITHSLNVSRVIKPSEALARAFALPLESRGPMRWRLRVLFVFAHQIVDGLSVVRWLTHFVHILNTPSTDLIRADIEKAVAPDAIYARLPPAQEDLYAPVASSRARTRWFWAITIVLRHVRKRPAPAAAFPNPLRRATPLSSARPFEARYPALFDYAQTPPLNTLTARARLSPAASGRLFRLCKEAGASVGAGGFALVAMSMMALHERRKNHPNEDERRPFRTSFPLNPRPFITNAAASDGLVLAFSPGISLPFLSSKLDLEGRFKLLARQASRQLAVYQKREKVPRSDSSSAVVETQQEALYMGLRGPGRLIASNYIDGVERMRELLGPDHHHSVPSPQGVYPAPVFHMSQTTCQVSSIGKVDFSAVRRRRRADDDQEDPGESGGGVVVASLESLMNTVRARDTEFAVATLSDAGIMQAEVSFDANVIDEDAVPAFLETMAMLLEEEPGPEGSGVKSRL
ncbi:hypothetical protein F5Y17DRAFT_182575 [Xylariaceae sp. FL0594]|nr:hypothetical protein F5Y17DRAFT_182575 [Xylariaceae sp. FL0594]